MELSFEAEHGVLTAVRLQGDYFGAAPVEELEASLVGCRLIRNELAVRLSGVERYIRGATPEQIAAMFEQ